MNRIHESYTRSTTIEFGLGNRPGIYMVASTFFDSAGRRLGRYAEYFRILKARTQVRQSISPTTAHGGDLLLASTENLGTTPIGSGNDFFIERYETGQWVLDSLTPSGFAGIGVVIFGGVAYDCHVLRLPIGVAPGHYRFHKVIELSPAHGPKRDVYADFFVSP